MAFVSKEFLNTTPTGSFTNFIEAIKSSGWEEIQVISATSVVLRTNGEDNLGPYIYFNFYITSGALHAKGYQYWTGGSGLCAFPSSTIVLLSASATTIRIYCTKSFILTDLASGYILMPRSPLRFFRTVSQNITGGASVTINLDSVSNLRVGFKYNIFGVLGEGQQEIQITARDTVNKTITVTGCSNNYAVGALVGSHVLTCITTSSSTSYKVDAFAFNKVGTTALPNSTNVYFVGKNGAEGAPYTHDSNYTLESLVAKGTYRFLGDLSSRYIKYGKGITSGDICFVVSSDEPIVDSVPSSFTEYTLTDLTANWSVDALIGKCVLFVSGTGSGYSRVIIGNTSNTLTFRTILPTITTTTGYRIVDAVYRSIPFEATALVKEEF